MEVMEAIRRRFSARSYEARAVEDAKLRTVLEAARQAPSAANMQEWHFIVVREAGLREQLMRAAHNQPFVARAPVVIAACATQCDKVMPCGHLAYPIDLAIAVSYMTLAATGQGLATCWLGAFDEPEVKRLLRVPDAVRVPILLTLGYQAGNGRRTPRRPLEDIVSYERFGPA